MSFSTNCIGIIQKKSLLQRQKYYHGTLPRSETNEFLQLPGDFLVRISCKTQGCNIIISLLHEDGRILHFNVNKVPDGFCLESTVFSNVNDLIKHYRTTKEPLTQETGAILVRPVHRASWLMCLEDIDMDRQIGSGNEATVFAGKMRNAEGEWIPAAIKKQKGFTISNKEKEKFMAEVRISLRLAHPNIIQIYGVCADTQNLLIVMELCSLGSLLDHVRKNKLPVETKLRLLYDAVLGMRDLAARNCLLGTCEETQSTVVKISDFGLSKEGTYTIMQGTQKTLPVRWMAPEALRGSFTEKSDVFSFAVVMWEVFTDGKAPWSEVPLASNVMKAIRHKQRLKFPDSTPDWLELLAKQCFEHEAKRRPTFDRLAQIFKCKTTSNNKTSSASTRTA